jgi:UDP-N-acetylglucosamine 3-dehydrogenase
MVQVGLIGCGRIANSHMAIFQSIGNIEVVAAYDVNVEKAKLFATKYNIPKVFMNHFDLFDRDLDFIDVCTPPSSHMQIVCDAAKFGRDVLLEKPMAISTSECDKMIYEAKKYNISLCVCHNQIFFPAIMKAKQLVDSGHYNILSFRTSIRENPDMFTVPSWNTRPEEKGIVWEAGYHPAYLHLHFLGDIKEVYAVGRKVKYPVFDEFAVFLRTLHQTYGILEVSWLSKQSEKIYEINTVDGKRAFMIAPPPYANQGYDVLLEQPGIAQSNVCSDLRKFVRHFVKKEMPLGYFVGHFYLIKNYVESVKKGAPPPVQPEEGRKTVKLLECIEQSLNTHEIVSVK